MSFDTYIFHYALLMLLVKQDNNIEAMSSVKCPYNHNEHTMHGVCIYEG